MTVFPACLQLSPVCVRRKTMATPTATAVGIQPQVKIAPSSDMRWHFTTRIAFRFLFIYWILYSFPFPLNYIPGITFLTGKYVQMWHAIEVWVGKHVLHLSYPITVFQNGSGDTTSDYVEALCFLALGVTAALVWSALDRNRAEYQTLHQWLR